MQRQLYGESRKVSQLEQEVQSHKEDGKRERERFEEEIRQLRETNTRLTITSAQLALDILQRDATIDRLERAHQVQRNNWRTLREAQEREIRELQELRLRSFGRPTDREYVWVRGQPRRRRGRAVFPARVNCRPSWKENKRRVLKLMEIAEAGEIRISDLDHAAKVDATKRTELQAELAVANETTQQLQQTAQQTIENLQFQMDRLNDELRGRAMAIGSRNLAILALREEMQVKDATIANLTQSVDEKDATIIARDSTIAAKETAIADLTHSRNEKEATITTHESTIANLTQSTNEKDATIIARDSTINALQVSTNQSSEAANTRIVELEASLATAEQSLATANESLVTATNTAQELESSLATANAEIEELASAAEAANGVTGAASTRITNLEGSLQRAQENAEAADRTIAQHERSLGTATMQRFILYADLGAAMTRITALEGDAVAANTRNVELEGSLGAANTRVTALEGSLAAAETENQNLQSSLSFVTTRYMARVSQVRALVDQVQVLMNDLAAKNQQIVLLQESSRITNQGAFQARRQLANANVRNVALVSQVHHLLNQLLSGVARSDDRDEDLYVAALRVSLCG